MKKDDTVFIKHILDAIDLIRSYLKDKSYEEFETNRMLQDAVIREIEIIGEATKNLSVELEMSGVQSPRLTLAGSVSHLAAPSYFAA